MAVQRTHETKDRFYQISDDGKQITYTRSLEKGYNLNESPYVREKDNDKVNNVAFKDRNPRSDADVGSGTLPTSPYTAMATQQAGTKSAARILGGVKTSDGTYKEIRVSDPINPQGADPAVVLPADSKIPHPDVVGTKVDLPAGSLPANVKPTGNGPDSGNRNVTDQNGNYIPNWLRK